MSEITDFYLSWLGNAAFGASGIRVRDQEPIVFKPTDLSDCIWWFDGNDNDAVVYNDLLVVSAWKNKGTLGGQFDASGGVIEYGQTTVNGLNVVTFNENAFMSASYAIANQAKSFFVVTKENTVLSGQANPWITSDTNGGIELFSQVNGTQVYFLGKHPSVIPELAAETNTIYTGYPALISAINATDLSDNYIAVNGTSLPFIYDAVASGYNTGSIVYYLGGYLNGSPVASAQDYCEVILYNRALNIPERIEVEKYLRTRWNIQEPPAPPPFSPQDISGLYIWFDANNVSSIQTDVSSNVLAWTNLGLASNVAYSNLGYGVSVLDSNINKNIVLFPQGTDMTTTMTLPYTDRTQFVVNLFPDDLSNYPSYPYTAAINSYTNSCLQTGWSYDTLTSNYFITMCQQGQNCPVVGSVSNMPASNYNLTIWVNDGHNLSNNLGYWNGGSNINTGIDLGNLFLQTSESYTLNNGTSNAPPNVLGEILEYNSVLSASTISTVANYLVTKWAISSFQTIV